jgi:hypothetical protein
MNQNPFNICKTGWVGKSVFWSGLVTTPNVYASDGVTVVTAGVPIDISLYKFRLTVKAKYSDPDSAAIYQFSWQIPEGTGTGGVWGVELPSAQMLGLSQPSTLVWDIQYKPSGATESAMFASGTIGVGNTVGTSPFTL